MFAPSVSLLRVFLVLSVVAYGIVNGAYLCPDGQPKAYQILALNGHNELRARHGSPPMTLNSTLNAIAEQCAVYYAEKKNVDHKCPYRPGTGENLISGGGGWTQTQFGKRAPYAWYSEIHRYDFNDPDCPTCWERTGHFTQVVWKESLELGFGVITIDGFTAGVAVYVPPGNVKGMISYRDNVGPWYL